MVLLIAKKWAPSESNLKNSPTVCGLLNSSWSKMMDFLVYYHGVGHSECLLSRHWDWHLTCGMTCKIRNYILPTDLKHEDQNMFKVTQLLGDNVGIHLLSNWLQKLSLSPALSLASHHRSTKYKKRAGIIVHEEFQEAAYLPWWTFWLWESKSLVSLSPCSHPFPFSLHVRWLPYIFMFAKKSYLMISD